MLIHFFQSSYIFIIFLFYLGWIYVFEFKAAILIEILIKIVIENTISCIIKKMFPLK